MSSHHVIRDEQEPPIIILTANFNMDLVNDLLGWSPLLIVVEEVYPFFEAIGIKVDIVIGLVEEDSVKYPEAQFIKITSLEELTYSTVLQVLQGKSFTGVNIFCSDKIKNNLIRHISKKPDLVLPLLLFVADVKTIVSSKTKHNKWYPSGQRLLYDDKNISVLPPITKKDGFYFVDVDAKYKFLIQDSLLIMTEY